MTSHEIQDIIDEHKQSIPDNVYLSISNVNKRKFEEEKIFFVEVNFLATKLYRPKELQYSIGLDRKTQIVQYTEEEFNLLSHILNIYSVCCKSLNDGVNYTGTFKNFFSKLIGNNTECLEAFDNEDSCISAFYIKNEIIITSIKKLN